MSRLSKARRTLASALLLVQLLPAHAEMVVVMSANSPVSTLSRNDVVNIYMGRYRQLPDGSPAIPLDAPPDSEEHRAFYRALVDRSPEEIKAYWARLVFAGRTRPPVPTSGIAAMRSEVAHHPNMLGYMERKDVGPQLRIVFALKE